MKNFEHASLAERLGRVKHFSGLSPKELIAIITSGHIKSYATEETIFLEDDPCDGLYVLLSGRVQICKHSHQGQISILAIFEPVIMFNEVAALDQGANPATAIALEPTTLWNLAPEELEQMILRYPRVGLGILRVLANRNRRLVSQFEDLSFRPVLARAAKLILELSQGGKIHIDRRKHPNYQLAAQIATVPEAFSRSLRVFRNVGGIETNDKQIRVVDPNRLQEIAVITPP